MVVAIGGGGGDRAGGGAVGGQRPGLAGGGGGDVEQLLAVEAELVGQDEGFGDAEHGDGQHHVVADLGGLAGAGGTGVDDVAAHALQDGLRGLEGGFGAAAHEGQRAGDGTAGAAGDGGVQHHETLAGGGLGDFLGGGDVDGGGIDQDGAGVQPVEDAAGAEIDGVHVAAGRQHGDDRLGAADGLGDGGSALAAIGDVLGNEVGVEVIAGHGVAGLEQVGGHGQAHVAQADERDVHGVASSSLRAMMTRMISLVPSRMRFTRRSRTKRSIW